MNMRGLALPVVSSKLGVQLQAVAIIATPAAAEAVINTRIEPPREQRMASLPDALVRYISYPAWEVSIHRAFATHFFHACSLALLTHFLPRLGACRNTLINVQYFQ